MLASASLLAGAMATGVARGKPSFGQKAKPQATRDAVAAPHKTKAAVGAAHEDEANVRLKTWN
jgi:hypothetical protein